MSGRSTQQREQDRVQGEVEGTGDSWWSSAGVDRAVQ